MINDDCVAVFTSDSCYYYYCCCCVRLQDDRWHSRDVAMVVLFLHCQQQQNGINVITVNWIVPWYDDKINACLMHPGTTKTVATVTLGIGLK